MIDKLTQSGLVLRLFDWFVSLSEKQQLYNLVWLALSFPKTKADPHPNQKVANMHRISSVRCWTAAIWDWTGVSLKRFGGGGGGAL